MKMQGRQVMESPSAPTIKGGLEFALTKTSSVINHESASDVRFLRRTSFLTIGECFQKLRSILGPS